MEQSELTLSGCSPSTLVLCIKTGIIVPYSLLPAPYSRLDAKREWGNHQNRAASPRPHCLPKTALHRYSLLPRNFYLRN
ncbi:MAG: hypothetical protein F6K55_38155 [Moorea sp. SIO4A3]|nr:hypothetical protein [Moorena sp. SIO4A3]